MIRCTGTNCSNVLWDGESCEDCEREVAKALHRVARFEGQYSPHIEHYPTRGYRVGVWPQGPRTSFVEIGYAATLTNALILLGGWVP